jgi:hypothetical protein
MGDGKDRWAKAAQSGKKKSRPEAEAEGKNCGKVIRGWSGEFDQ